MSHFYTREELKNIDSLINHIKTEYNEFDEDEIDDLVGSIIEVLEDNFTYSPQKLRDKVSRLSNRDRVLCDIVQDIAFDIALSITERLGEIRNKCLDNLY